jgi:anti-anti-sigma factor
MAMQPLEARVRHLPRIAIIDLQGDILATSEETLNAAYAEACSQDPATILLNFGGVQYIDSNGISVIVGLLTRVRQSRRRLLAFGLSEHYLEIFRITRLDDFMRVFPDETSALADASAP